MFCSWSCRIRTAPVSVSSPTVKARPATSRTTLPPTGPHRTKNTRSHTHTATSNHINTLTHTFLLTRWHTLHKHTHTHTTYKEMKDKEKRHANDGKQPAAHSPHVSHMCAVSVRCGRAFHVCVAVVRVCVKCTTCAGVLFAAFSREYNWSAHINKQYKTHIQIHILVAIANADHRKITSIYI